MIAAVVLTYDPPPGMLEDCLASLLAGGDVEVILVDNGGRTDRLPSTTLAGIDLLVPGRNLGFAAGMNLGIRRALDRGADAVMVLNDDVVVEPGWLAPLAAELAVDRVGERVGAVQPTLLFAGEPPTINSLGVALGHDGAGTDVGMHDPDDPSDVVARDLAIFTGGAVLFAADFVRETDGFDERFFLYYEDVDLALRGTELGWRYRLAPASRVRHRGSATVASIGSRSAYFRERNRIWVLFRHRPWSDVGRGLWLSVRRLRWAPRGAHAKALVAGLVAAPRLVRARRHASNSL
ncbi:MAG: glycosyltransferase family 2 protein [Actinobacteria bacterium]|nr:glycosyltransferase family 2 protein [Actinomycetota bacterium]